MEPVTVKQCADVIRENNLARIGHHKCSMCGYPTGYVIGDDGVTVLFDAGCDCTGRYTMRESSLDDIVNLFNMQKPEIRARMWDDFKAGKPLID